MQERPNGNTTRNFRFRAFDSNAENGGNGKSRVIATEELLKNLNNTLSFKDLRHRSTDVVRDRSRELINRLCDKDRTYFYQGEMDRVNRRLQHTF